MIVGIGTDIVSVRRIAALLAKYGERFARRILSDRELGEFHRAGRPAALLARRFAAKEAVAKALGTGIRAPFTFNTIEVRRRPHEAPRLHFLGDAARGAEERGIARAMLSISDERDYAVAFVVLVSE